MYTVQSTVGVEYIVQHGGIGEVLYRYTYIPTYTEIYIHLYLYLFLYLNTHIYIRTYKCISEHGGS